MYYRFNDKKITFPFKLDIGGNTITIPTQKWFNDKTDEELLEWGVTKHPSPVQPSYDNATQQLQISPQGEWVVVDLTQQEIDARKPKSVSMRQARLALIEQGLLANVESRLNSLPSPDKEKALVEWEYATSIERDSISVQNISAQMGWTSTDIDNLFNLASTL